MNPAQHREEITHSFGCREDVEGWGQGGPVVEVAHPQLSPGKLPLLVFMALHRFGDKRLIAIGAERNDIFPHGYRLSTFHVCSPSGLFVESDCEGHH